MNETSTPAVQSRIDSAVIRTTELLRGRRRRGAFPEKLEKNPPEFAEIARGPQGRGPRGFVDRAGGAPPCMGLFTMSDDFDYVAAKLARLERVLHPVQTLRPRLTALSVESRRWLRRLRRRVVTATKRELPAARRRRPV